MPGCALRPTRTRRPCRATQTACGLGRILGHRGPRRGSLSTYHPPGLGIGGGGMSEVQNVLQRLERVEERNGYWMALCPAHNDRNPSLSIKEGDNGRPLLYCHAGCSFEQIMAELSEVSPARLRVRRARGEPTKVWRGGGGVGGSKGDPPTGCGGDRGET